MRGVTALSLALLFVLASCKKDEAKGGGDSKLDLKAKAGEAVVMLDKIAQGAVTYFAEPKVSADGTKLPCQFPKAVACTPDADPCKSDDKRFAPDSKTFDADTWRALTFDLSDPHYFKYCFESAGTLGEAVFTVTAHADLDCDGTWSTFSRTGFADAGSDASECRAKAPRAMFIDNELE